ncbi:MAG: hypothetical protein CSA70_04210 [Rhodobacterales bacterium]|nr:MAG: hypothetical protein CSA70_04210 [Rhodobacterales bacterium]
MSTFDGASRVFRFATQGPRRMTGHRAAQGGGLVDDLSEAELARGLARALSAGGARIGPMSDGISRS